MRVNFVSLLNKIRPKDHIDVLRRVLPSRYSPLCRTPGTEFNLSI